MKPIAWVLFVDGILVRRYSQRAAANGAAMVAKANGHTVSVQPIHR